MREIEQIEEITKNPPTLGVIWGRLGVGFLWTGILMHMCGMCVASAARVLLMCIMLPACDVASVRHLLATKHVGKERKGGCFWTVFANS